MALVDTSSFWIAGYFKETQLPHIQVGQKAIVTLIGHENQPFQGVVRSVGWGIYVQDGSGSTGTALLPSVSQRIDWVRLPQRFAVRLRVVGRLPVPLRIGQTVYVAMTAMVERTEAPKKPLVTVEHGLTNQASELACWKQRIPIMPLVEALAKYAARASLAPTKTRDTADNFDVVLNLAE